MSRKAKGGKYVVLLPRFSKVREVVLDQVSKGERPLLSELAEKQG